MEPLLERMRTEGMARAYGLLQRDMALALLREARTLAGPDALDWEEALVQIEALCPERQFGARELLERKDLACVEEAVRLRPRRVWRLLEAVAHLVEALTDGEEEEDTLELLDDLAEAARVAYVRARASAL
jgi:hypothetical protein